MIAVAGGRMEFREGLFSKEGRGFLNAIFFPRL